MTAGLRDYIATRRTTPATELDGPGPDEATLREMLTIAARVPDHGKLARWRFIVFEGDARHRAGEALADVAQGIDLQGERLELERQRFARAPLVVGVISTAAPHPKIPEWEQVLSAGAVCLNLIHAAAAYGFKGQWLTEWYAYDGAAKGALGIAEAEKVAGFIHIGRARSTPPDRSRPDVDALVSRFGSA